MAQNSLLMGCLPFRYKIYATLDLSKYEGGIQRQCYENFRID